MSITYKKVQCINTSLITSDAWSDDNPLLLSSPSPIIGNQYAYTSDSVVSWELPQSIVQVLPRRLTLDAMLSIENATIDREVAMVGLGLPEGNKQYLTLIVPQIYLPTMPYSTIKLDIDFEHYKDLFISAYDIESPSLAAVVVIALQNLSGDIVQGTLDEISPGSYIISLDAEVDEQYYLLSFSMYLS